MENNPVEEVVASYKASKQAVISQNARNPASDKLYKELNNCLQQHICDLMDKKQKEGRQNEHSTCKASRWQTSCDRTVYGTDGKTTMRIYLVRRTLYMLYYHCVNR